MNTVMYFLAGAIEAYWAEHAAPLIDEDYFMAFDSALIYAGTHSDATIEQARASGALRVTDPVGWQP